MTRVKCGHCHVHELDIVTPATARYPQVTVPATDAVIVGR